MDKKEQQEKPIKVTVTGAAGNVGYALCFMIGLGNLIPKRKINLYLLEIPFMKNSVEGVKMEIEDCAFPLINKVVATTCDKIAFENCEIALLVGAKPRGKGMKRKDLLLANANIFKSQGKFLDEFADKNCKVCVVGNPANTNALILARNCQRICKKNITALTRLDMNRSLNQISKKLNVSSNDIKNVIIWGNHSSTQFPDLQKCILKKNNKNINVNSLLNSNWVQNEFLNTIQKRGSEIIKMRNLSSAASAANAICDHVRNWMQGTENGEIISMVVFSDKNPYGVENGLFFSFPVFCKNGEWFFDSEVNMNSDYFKKMIRITEKELIEERNQVIDFLKE